jgi:hypothetical protein
MNGQCSKPQDKQPFQICKRGLSVVGYFLGLFLIGMPAYARVKVNPLGPPKCANIYYDRSPKAGYTFGRTHALFLQNLLGHFPNIQQYVAPIETYIEGEIDRCEATIYLGTHYETEVPEAFRQDFISTSRHVLWAGYHIWGFDPATLNQLWGVNYSGLTTIEPNRPDRYGQPGFFRQISRRFPRVPPAGMAEAY